MHTLVIEKMIATLIGIYILTISIPLAQAQRNSDFMDQIVKEAKILKNNKAEYQKYLDKEISLFQRRSTDIKRGMHVLNEPDLTTINAPLAYFYIRLNENLGRWYFYFKDGIARSQDIQHRQKYVLYLESNKKTLHKGLLDEAALNWNYYISVSGNAAWANNYIASQKQVEAERDYRETLPYQVINHWADSLNIDNKTTAHNYLKRIYDKGPSNGDGVEFFHLFYRLKPIETQNELVEYWSKDGNTSNHYVLSLLSQFNTENQHAAKKIMEIRSDCSGKDELKSINTALFFLNPEQGKKEMIEHLENEISGKESLWDQYTNLDKVLQKFAADLCESTDEIQVLKNYITSDAVGTFGDVNRFKVLKIIRAASPKHYDQLVKELKEKESKTAKTNYVLLWAEKEFE